MGLGTPSEPTLVMVGGLVGCVAHAFLACCICAFGLSLEGKLDVFVLVVIDVGMY